MTLENMENTRNINKEIKITHNSINKHRSIYKYVCIKLRSNTGENFVFSCPPPILYYDSYNSKYTVKKLLWWNFQM